MVVAMMLIGMARYVIAVRMVMVVMTVVVM